MLVYFDTNVFDPRDGVSEAAEPFILNALLGQRIRLVFDLDCFLEPLLTFQGLASDATPRASLAFVPGKPRGGFGVRTTARSVQYREPTVSLA
jgi:hypothetical protein